LLKILLARKTTIFRQLVFNLIVPVTLALGLFSYISYYFNKLKLEEYYSEQRKFIVDEIKSLIMFYDYSMAVHEESFSGRMQKMSEKMQAVIAASGRSPEKLDLYKLSTQIGMDTTTEFVYIIDTNCIIINTTFRKDYLLDFYKIDKHFKTFFDKMRTGGKFVADRFSYEINTGSIKKYSYLPTRDANYLIEMGFASQRAVELKSMLSKKVESISKQYSHIHNIHLVMAAEVKDHNIKKATHAKAFNKAMRLKKSIRISEGRGADKKFIDFIYLPIRQSSLFEGYMIVMESDDSLRLRLISDEIKKFIIIFICTLVPLFIIIMLRARNLTRPIIRLSKKAASISSGNLNERVEVEGRNEISTLSENFNSMVDKLQESYNTLEQKVIERTAQLHEQKVIIEEKNKEIVDSINYAQRIQQALLPNDSEFKMHFTDSFVLFKPKDIVSGDYYWIANTAHYIFYATADCTGHGVPGGFMSMLGTSFLNELVNEKQIYEPAEILNQLREKVMQALKQTGSVGENKDGMDLVLCRVNRNKTKLVYAAANNGFYLVRNGNISEYKPDKMPIGHYAEMKPFSQHVVTLEPGDRIYTFTDGYADQFGGPKGKKFKYSSLNKLILDYSTRSMGEQCQLLSTAYEQWKNGFEQTDDVCIIGVTM
jgi:serine phosphatase RsbU (regulator of sigma subunit)